MYINTNTYIHILYMPRTCVHELPFSIGKGSMAALKGAASEQQGSKGEHKRAQESTREQRGSNARATRGRQEAQKPAIQYIITKFVRQLEFRT